MATRLLEPEALSFTIPLEKRSLSYKSSADVDKILQLISIFGHKIDEEVADIFRKKIPNEEIEETKHLILTTSQTFDFEEGVLLGSVRDGGAKFGYGPCSLVNVLNFLLQIQHPGCKRLPIITKPLEMRYGAGARAYALLFHESVDGKFQLSRVNYNPEQYIHPLQPMLFCVLD